jgi:exodeoxyribonuclease VII large subunit
MDAVAWRGTVGKLNLKLEEGMEVIVTGRVSSYPKSSRYQIVIESVELAGEGALLKLLEDRRRKLSTEGLFDPDRKRALPFLPDVIGVITSPTGAVIRDILHRLDERFPRHVLIWPVPVQGDGAAGKIAAAIEGFNALKQGGKVPRPDVLIVARGGGSLEDLWEFNEEILVRAAAVSKIPLISAVGHETDTTLIDYASDRRAPTPTAAAEIVVPVRAELMAQLLDDDSRLIAASGRLIEVRRAHIEGLARGLPRPLEILETAMQRVDNATDRLATAVSHGIERAGAQLAAVAAGIPHPGEQIKNTATRLANADGQMGAYLRALVRARVMALERLSPFERMSGGILRSIDNSAGSLQSAEQLLESLSYERVLERGFALVRDADGEPIMHAERTEVGQAVSIHFADGNVGAIIETDGFEPVKKPKKKNSNSTKTRKNKAAMSRDRPLRDQGSLF